MKISKSVVKVGDNGDKRKSNDLGVKRRTLLIFYRLFPVNIRRAPGTVLPEPPLHNPVRSVFLVQFEALLNR